MSHRIAYALVWLLSSALLLCTGFLGTVYVALLFGGGGDPEMVRRLSVALATYAQVVLLKGLLPQLVLALALWPVLDRVFSLRRRGRAGIAVGLVAGSAVASLAVAALLLPLPYWGLGSVHYKGTANFLRTCAELTGATALALIIPRLLMPPRTGAPTAKARRWRALIPLTGVAVAALVGFLLVARNPQVPAPAATGRAVEPVEPGAAPTPVAAPDRAPTEAAPADARAIPLPLHLLMTQVEALPSESLAVFLDRDARTTETLHEGDPFAHHPQARLARIEAERVLIDNGGRLEELRVGTAEELLALFPVAEVSPEARAQMHAITDTLRERIAAEREGRGDELNETVRGGLLADGNPRPVYGEDGALQGIGLENLRSGGAFDRIGLRDGDLVTAVNGVSFQSLSGAEVVRQLSTSPQLELSVERSDGTQASISLSTATLLQQLQALETPPNNDQ